MPGRRGDPGGRLSAGSAFVVSFVAPGLGAPHSSHASRFALMPFAPNPTRGSGMASYLVPSATAIRLSVCDVQGREVSLLDEGERAAGLHLVPLDATRLRPGLYFMRLTGAGVDLQQRVVVAR
jgi:hypothetical protein